jgi:hypothetical protein
MKARSRCSRLAAACGRLLPVTREADGSTEAGRFVACRKSARRHYLVCREAPGHVVAKERGRRPPVGALLCVHANVSSKVAAEV